MLPAVNAAACALVANPKDIAKSTTRHSNRDSGYERIIDESPGRDGLTSDGMGCLGAPAERAENKPARPAGRDSWSRDMLVVLTRPSARDTHRSVRPGH